MSADFLVELGTEELPPKNLKNLMNAFAESIQADLTALELSFTSVKAYAAPRRLALLVENLASESPSKELVVWGPPAAIAFDKEGQPTKAALAFAEKNGIAASALKAESDGKVEKLVARLAQDGQKTVELLEKVVGDALAKLPIAKRMKWGSKREEFVRPVHWLVMLFGSDVVSASVLGLTAGRTTRGHRFHYNQPIELANASDYASVLKNTGYVVADFAERSAIIKDQVEAEAKNIGGVAVIDPALLDEVTALVEWPVALTGQFEERFLAVPAEALIASMKEHQKYFHVVDANGKLKNYFITVANLQSKDPTQIIDGNERVIRPRLSDAAFFFETDKKTTLASLRERLKTIVFQAQLGTIYQKTERVAKLAQFIAGKLKADEASAVRAAELCKSDLVTNMVGEFDDMQGIAGFYYALNDGENAEVAAAMNEQYMPRFAGDQLPATATGAIIALADRLDTISGIFGIGQQPSGSKDPFALRRASIAVLRLLVEKNLALDLRELLTFAKAQHNNLTVGEELVDQVLGYMLDRFRAMFEDAQIPAEVFQAVNAKQLSQPLDINQRVLAVNEFSKLPQAQALAAANKRVSNILAKQNADVSAAVNPALLQEEAEKNLAQAVGAKAAVVAPLFASREYTQALAALADLQPVVDAFFDNVMVMADDPALQQNRLALLQQLRGLFLEVADISYLVPAKN
ncbi:glycine--tRNA ligase subunit beta [Cellvibrio japonicus]|uniref:Glycine--tRNA ligase beta subunit n=1 Tax=Cellvibrio japonicus (strain Ueda107) TaxID=498211 RepID=B3PFE0_CELJU|nr:glycine--tRNA ligase subunit beta [Cellvibrio japonicus]ACE83324.1 glycyl-tRNA synthetase, beta subunit [Cellvibrio japonicus Ueda107]QEI10813.1 glycine--tRNA ligase subunit beta [Cellvibrio japonicus]QEI14389.1 glycine--tRNA ligase subunit beta [Cellvibrio japonicus]QEI17967.1 glycine--tRNA ligase subunit beta [Cellvibrio japonicus]